MCLVHRVADKGLSYFQGAVSSLKSQKHGRLGRRVQGGMGVKEKTIKQRIMGEGSTKED